MAKSSGQKLKLLYVAEILEKETDENHPITTKELIERLEAMGITAERKSIYDDIEKLTDFGMDIISIKEKPGGYYVGSREFELAELKLLVDAVLSSKFITEGKTRELIGKLEKLTDKYSAGKLHREVVVSDRNKTVNESVYYAVDMIHDAINSNRQISFQYYEWNTKKEQVLRKNGELYVVSPWYLVWEDENYYLMGYDEKADTIKHYRVDKMLHLSMVNRIRMGRRLAEKIDVAALAKRTFGMFGGDIVTVNFIAENSLAGVCIDRFGIDVPMRYEDDDHVRVRADVAVSPQFYAWLSGFGGRIKIASPEEEKEKYISWLKQILNACDDQ
ncbi:MAG: WYL domain-containing protein [Lachnospiraceae bacterium]|nr:WYL domain-containing protein [Lachnospiraceae bacterium]